jgi:hypothetical protein
MGPVGVRTGVGGAGVVVVVARRESGRWKEYDAAVAATDAHVMSCPVCRRGGVCAEGDAVMDREFREWGRATRDRGVDTPEAWRRQHARPPW